MTEAANACKGRLEQFFRRELAGWHGLPQQCVAEDLPNSVKLRSGEGLAHFGTAIVEYRFRVADTAGFTEPVRLYFGDGALRLIRTGLWSTDRSVCQGLLRELGDPPDRLDLTFGMGVVARAEWVYATRGLMLAVVSNTGLIANVAGYPPCTLEVYRRRYRDAEPAREFPPSRRP
jgi:hypothetical protein